MARKYKDLKKKIASLSALGAGALVFGVVDAEAGVVYSGVLDQTMGFTSGIPVWTSGQLGTSAAQVGFRAATGSFFSSATRQVRAYGVNAGFAQNGGLMQLFGAGAIWTAAMQAGNSALVGGRVWGSASSGTGTSSSGFQRKPFQRRNFSFASLIGNGPFNNQYALFTFLNGSQTLYGWVQLSFAVSPSFGWDPAFGPELTIHDFAFDDSGAYLAAGQTEAASTPEPGTLASTGLAALALGAVGLRSWRKNRKAA